MKAFLNKRGTVIGFSVFLLMIFVFGGMYSRYMTNQIDVHDQARFENSLINLVDGGSELETFESNGSDKTYIRESTGNEYNPDLLASYKVLDENQNEIAYVYVIETRGCSEGLIAAYAISLENDHMLGVNVISHHETTSVEGMYYNLITDEFFDRFEQKDLDVVDFSIDVVAGATYTSMAYDTGIKYARELYANDTDFEIISLILNIEEVRYNHDLNTLADYPFIVDITFGQSLHSATVALNNDLEYVETLSGQQPSSVEIAALPSYVISADALNIHHITVESYTESTRTIRLVTRGFSQPGVVIDVILNATLDGIEAVNFVSSTENYDNEYNNGYQGDDVPAVEVDYIDQYNTDGTIIDAVSGATVTSGTMTLALEWVVDLEMALSGGN